MLGIVADILRCFRYIKAFEKTKSLYPDDWAYWCCYTGSIPV